jgi:hypothetical protein
MDIQQLLGSSGDLLVPTEAVSTVFARLQNTIECRVLSTPRALKRSIASACRHVRRPRIQAAMIAMQDLSEKLQEALLPVLHYQPAAPLVQLCSQ